MNKQSFRDLLNESEDDVLTKKDVFNLIDSLNLSPNELEDLSDYILSGVFFDDELEFVDTDEVQDDDDEYFEVHDDDDDGDELDEAFIKTSKGIRYKTALMQKKKRRLATVKNDLSKRAEKASKCNKSQRVEKVSKGVYKCVAKTAKDKRRSIRMRKWKKIYKTG